MKSKNEITVIVGGGTSVGKSTIVMAIKQQLEKLGINVKFDGGIDYANEVSFDKAIGPRFTKSIKAVRAKSKVVIKEVQTKTDMTQ
jgi:nucleoside-triphosphatase THEP1